MDEARTVPARLLSLALAAAVVFGTTQPWAEFVLVTFSGTEFEPGLATLGVGLAAAAISFWGAISGPRGVKYYLPAFVCGIAMLAIPIWFMVELARRSTQEFFGVSVTLLDPGAGLYLCIGAAAAYIAVLVIQLFVSRGRERNTSASGRRAVTCGDCGAVVSMSDRECPACGKVFAS